MHLFTPVRSRLALGAVGALTLAIGAGTVALAAAPPSTPPPSTSPSSTPSSEIAAGSTTLPLDAELFVGDGWSMAVPTTWQFVANTEPPPAPIRSQFFWNTGVATPTFGSNVNVLVEPVPSPMSLEDYLNLNVVNVEQGLDAEILDSSQIEVPGGPTLARIEYLLTAAEPLKVLAILTAVDGGFAVATFVAPVDGFDAEALTVEPAMLTLAPSTAAPTITPDSTTP